MAAQLKGTVFVTDPDTRQTVELAPGTSPEPRLAALVTNPAAWVDGKLPRLPKAKAETEGGSLFGSDPDGASGDASADSGDADDQSEDDSEDTKPAARKTAAKRPARGRTTAAEGTGGQ